MENIVLILLGILIIFIGILNIMGNISLIHSYNRRKITEATRKPYGRAVGTGTVIIGASMIISSVLKLISHGEWPYYIITAGAVIGLIFILYGQFRYNKGLF